MNTRVSYVFALTVAALLSISAAHAGPIGKAYDLCINVSTWGGSGEGIKMVYPAGYEDCARIVAYVQEQAAKKLAAQQAAALAKDKIILVDALARIAAKEQP